MTGIRNQGSEPPVRQNSPSFEDTTALHGNPLGLAAKRIRRGNAASVTQLASLRCHISNAPRHPARDGLRGQILLRAAFSPAPLSVLLRKTPAGALGRCSFAVFAAQTPVVEAFGESC